MRTIVIYEHDNSYALSLITDILRERNSEYKEIQIEDEHPQHEYAAEIESFGPEYLITLDMAGFQMLDYVGEAYYNILVSKQIHIVLDEFFYGLYCNQDFALNLYFFIPESSRDWKSENRNIPNIFRYSPFIGQEAEDKKKIEFMLDLVISESRCEEKTAEL